MIINEWLKYARDAINLENDTAQLDAEVILAHTLKVDRSWLHAHPEYEIKQDDLKLLNSHLERRNSHEPIAYILESTEFYGREFYIINGVLVPRPESETMIDLFKKNSSNKKLDNTVLVDVGTGSGALAITAVLETGINKCVAIDIDDLCLSVAKKNADIYELNIEFKNGDLLEPIQGEKKLYELIVLANLPYVPDRYSINSEAKNEPARAIFGGEDGLDLYRKLFKQLNNLNTARVELYTESLPFQHADLAKIAENSGFTELNKEDFIQVFSN